MSNARSRTLHLGTPKVSFPTPPVVADGVLPFPPPGPQSSIPLPIPQYHNRSRPHSSSSSDRPRQYSSNSVPNFFGAGRLSHGHSRHSSIDPVASNLNFLTTASSSGHSLSTHAQSQTRPGRRRSRPRPGRRRRSRSRPSYHSNAKSSKSRSRSRSLTSSLVLSTHSLLDPSEAEEIKLNSKQLSHFVIGTVDDVDDTETTSSSSPSPSSSSYRIEDFENLYFLELGDNYFGKDELLMKKIAGLPCLMELHLHCNGICPNHFRIFQEDEEDQDDQDVVAVEEVAMQRRERHLSFTYHRLVVLNLSFNLVTETADLFNFIEMRMPRLERLNLAHNKIRRLSNRIAQCSTLKFLSLEANLLREDVWAVLCAVPQLQKINLAKNRIRRVWSRRMAFKRRRKKFSEDDPSVETPESDLFFPKLKMLSLGENVISFSTDVASLGDMPWCQKVFLFDNPIAQRSADLSEAIRLLGKVGIDVILNGPIPPPTKDVPMSEFLRGEKVLKVRSFEQIKRSILKRTQRVLEEKRAEEEAAKSREDERGPESSFFITEVNVKSKNPQPATSGPVADLKSKVVAAQQDLEDFFKPDRTRRAESTDPSASAAPSASALPPQVLVDYNRDWFKLDAALDSIVVDKDDPYVVYHTQKSRGRNRGRRRTVRTTRALYDELRNVLRHTLVVREEDDLLERLAANRNRRRNRKSGQAV